MKKLLLLITFIFLLLLSGCKNTNRALLVPVYFYDLDLWDRVANASSNEIVIINPSNGPGESIDDNYQEFIDKLIKNSKKPIGYIYTKWGDRDIKLVKKDIDTWLKLYPNIEGFFIDESATDLDKLSYYKELKNYIDSKGNYYISLNPGTVPQKEYFNISDNIVVFENDISKLDKDYCQDNSDKSTIIAYNANESQMKNILNSYSCKNFYITDDNLPNPYDLLPTYFDKEVEEIEK